MESSISLPSNLNFRKKMQMNSNPTYQRIVQQSGGVTQAIPLSGGNESIWQIPNRVFNPADSFLSYIYYPTANGANNFNFVYNDCLSTIRQLQFYTKNGLMLVDIPDLANYCKMVWKSQIKLNDYLTFEKYEDSFTTDNTSFIAGTQEVQTITITTAATSGSYVLSLYGETSGVLSFNSNLATISSIINQMNILRNNGVTVAVTGTAANGLNSTGTIIFTFTPCRPIQLEFGSFTIIQCGPLAALVVASFSAALTTAGVVGYLANGNANMNDRSNWGKMIRPSNDRRGTIKARRPDNSFAAVDFIEPQYFQFNYTVNAVGPYIKVKIPFSLLFDTFLSLNKSISLGDISYLRVVWQPASKVYWIANSQSYNDPIGTGALAPVGAAGVGYTYNQLYLFLSVESDPKIINDVNDIISKEGLKILFPFVKYNKINLQGGSQTIPIIYTKSDGKKLVKVYHSVFNNTESANTAYDNSNNFIPNLANQTQKVQQFYTAINGDRRQQFDLICRNNEDYMYLYNKLRGSIITDPLIHYYNWTWIEDFSDEHAPDEKNKDNDVVEKGLSLERDIKFEFNGVVMANANFNHYTYGITQKEIIVKGGEVMLI